MIRYDETVVYKFAERLYSRAKTIVIWTTLLSGVSGFGIAHSLNSGGVGSTIWAVFAAIAGLLVGLEFAFWIRLRAQIALCQVQNEENTRIIAKTMAGPRAVQNDEQSIAS